MLNAEDAFNVIDQTVAGEVNFMLSKMSPGSKSLLGCAAYIIPTGLGLMIIPNTILGMFGLPETSEVYLRITGMLLTFLGVYYFDAARTENKTFMKRTVHLRLIATVSFVYFVLSGLGPTILYMFAAFDLAGAIWTQWAMRRS